MSAINYQSARFEAAYANADLIPESTTPEVTVVGRSNVGKSSLLNKLFMRKNLAYVSNTPGKTANINFYMVDGIRFVDLPGYGYAKVSQGERQRWADLIDDYFNQDRSFNLVISLVDIRHEAQPLDLDMIDYIVEGEYPFVVALTKADKLGRSRQNQQKAAIAKQLDVDPGDIIVTSSVTGQGIDELRRRIADACL